MAAEQNAFGVYVHWPFCLSKCPYCDFNSHVRHAPIDEERFVRAFAREIETTAQRVGARNVSSIFLGGGTPSLMRPETVGARSEEHTSELQSPVHLVCRLLLEKKKKLEHSHEL